MAEGQHSGNQHRPQSRSPGGIPALPPPGQGTLRSSGLQGSSVLLVQHDDSHTHTPWACWVNRVRAQWSLGFSCCLRSAPPLYEGERGSREARGLVQGHTLGKWQHALQNPGRSMLFPLLKAAQLVYMTTQVYFFSMLRCLTIFKVKITHTHFFNTFLFSILKWFQVDWDKSSFQSTCNIPPLKTMNSIKLFPLSFKVTLPRNFG